MIEELNKLVQDFKKGLKAKGRQQATINSYATDASSFLLYLTENRCPYKEARVLHLNHFIEELEHKKKERQNSLRRKIISIRQFYQHLLEQDLVDSNPFLAHVIPKRNEALPHELCFEDVQNFISAAQEQQNPLKSTRDPAIIALLAIEGLKVTELVALKGSSLLISEKEGTLQVNGLRSRIIELDSISIGLLGKYVAELKRQNLFKSDARLFTALKGKESGKILGQMTRHGMKFLLYEIGEQTDHPKLNTELLRHHAINYQLEKKQNLQAVQSHFGLRQGGNILKHLNKKKLETREST